MAFYNYNPFNLNINPVKASILKFLEISQKDGM